MATVRLDAFSDDTIVLHFCCPEGATDAYTLANALIGFADTAYAINATIDPGQEIEIIVEATGPGSYLTVIRKLKKGFTGGVLSGTSLIRGKRGGHQLRNRGEGTLLEVFRDLTVTGPDVPRAFEKLRHNPPPSWKVDDRATEDLDDQSIGEKHLVLQVEPKAGRPSANVFVFFIGKELKVTNIVPRQVHQLTMYQYNHILEELNDWVLKLGAEGMSITPTITADRLDVTTLLGLEATKALKAFSSSANKNTGSSHPMDRDRWFKFLVLAHRDSAKIDTQTLYRWLTEEEQWPEDQADRLVIEFEFASGLLNDYDRLFRR
jgi:hypothetical protein